MASYQPKTILAMGLTAGIKPEHLKWTNEATLAAAAKEQEHLSKLNVTMDIHLVDPSQPVSKHISDIKAILNNKPYDGVSIGFGVRGSEEFTPIFTALVNLIVEEGKNPLGNPSKLLFGLRPDAMVDAVQGVWPEYV